MNTLVIQLDRSGAIEMKIMHYFYLLLTIVLMLSGCVSVNSTSIPTLDVTQFPSPAILQPTDTPILTATVTSTLTPPVTLEPAEARETIGRLLREPVNCAAPCFWGIVPEETSLGEAINVFVRLGLQPQKTNTRDNKDFYEINYKSLSGLSISSLLTIQNDTVKNLTINLHPEKQQVGVPREWLAYSPETLIAKYGFPSKVNFIVDRGPRPAYTMGIYFDAVDLIIEYSSYDLDPKWQVCPVTDQIDYIRQWLGSNPQNPPPVDPSVISLEQATSLTIEEFSNLMTANPNKACFHLKEEMFR